MFNLRNNYIKSLSWLMLLIPTIALAELPSVKVATVQKMVTPPRLSLTGVVTNKSEFDVISAVNGYLEFIQEPGVLITKGAVIAKLDSSLLALDVRELKAKIQRQKIHIQFYTKELKRLNTLKETQSVSPSERDEVLYQQELAQNQMQILETQLNNAEIQLHRAIVKAPIAGVLSQRERREGEYIESGALLGHFLAKYDLEGQVRVPIHYAQLLRQGQLIQVSDDMQDVNASIEAIIPKVDERSQTMRVRFSIAESMQKVWRTGQQLKVLIPSMQHQALLIPRDALLVEIDKAFVMRVSPDSQQLQKVAVTVGYGEGSTIAIKPISEGTLNAGDNVVIRGERLLTEGTKVSVEHL